MIRYFRMMRLDYWLFGGAGITVGFFWRFLSGLLGGALMFSALYTQSGAGLIYRLDMQVLDLWQRMAPADEPTGKVVVVGIDKAAIRDHGRWPWDRSKLAELVEQVAKAKPASLTLDILLTEPGPYSDLSLFRKFRGKAGSVIESRGESPDARLARALSLVPTTLAVAGGGPTTIDEGWPQAQCADPTLVNGSEARPYYVPCLLYPLNEFYNVAADAISLGDQDTDGVVRRARALVAQPYFDDESQTVKEYFIKAMPVAAITTCASPGETCPRVQLDVKAFTAAAGPFQSTYRLPLVQTDLSLSGPPLTDRLSFWLDYGAMPEMAETAIVSADDILDQAADQSARLTGKHVFLGLTRIGEIDRHTTPLATESGAPGVLIQALAADNLLGDRAFDENQWAHKLAIYFGFALALGSIFRFGISNLSILTGLGVVLLIGPLINSYILFMHLQMLFRPSLYMLAVLIAGSPIVFGRIMAIRRDLAIEEIRGARDGERINAAREIQLGSLPFDADFSDIGIETGKICRPSQEVGGDFFELFQLSDNRLFGVVGDVSGKGLEASLVTSLSKSISGAVADRTTGPIGEALTQISREFIRQAPRDWRLEKGGFVTFVAVRIDPKTGEAEFAAAGCEPPVVVSADGTHHTINLPSVAPLGWIEDATFETVTYQMQPGDSIAMFTDGVTEAETPEGALFGQERAEQIVSQSAAGGASEILARLEAEVLAHQQGHDPTDDTTILTLTWRGPTS
ncbi:MAG: SpoIIE family protein phosphatase [Pikeienuella sp.]